MATYFGAMAAVVHRVVSQAAGRPDGARTDAGFGVCCFVGSVAAGTDFYHRGVTAEVVVLSMLNAVLVAFTAMGVYERAIALLEAEKTTNSLRQPNYWMVSITT